MCFVWISEQTAIISLYSINLSVFITEAESVYCAVRTGSLNRTDTVSYLNLRYLPLKKMAQHWLGRSDFFMHQQLYILVERKPLLQRRKKTKLYILYIKGKSKLEVPHIQATKALRVCRGIALPYLRPRHWRWGWGFSITSRPLYPRERHGTHCTGGWVGPTAGLDGCRKSRPPPGFDPRTVQPVASRYTDWAIQQP